MSGPAGERCGICYFVVDGGAVDDHSGICKRWPPKLHDLHEDKGARWVSSYSWCGEFKLHPNMSKHLSRFRPVQWHDDEVAP